MDVDKAATPTSSTLFLPNGSSSPEAIRFVRYSLSGHENVWYVRHDSPEVLNDWYEEIRQWKREWYEADWKKNLFVQTPRVPVEPGSDWDLAYIVAKERTGFGDSITDRDSAVIFDRGWLRFRDRCNDNTTRWCETWSYRSKEYMCVTLR